MDCGEAPVAQHGCLKDSFLVIHYLTLKAASDEERKEEPSWRRTLHVSLTGIAMHS